jgi:hypothetical protein
VMGSNTSSAVALVIPPSSCGALTLGVRTKAYVDNPAN